MKTFKNSPKLKKMLLMAGLSLALQADMPVVAMEEIIGSWQRSDKSIVEFRPDGKVYINDAQVGTWQKLADSSQFNVFINGKNNYYFKTRLSSYQRKLTMENSNGTGTETTLDRIDNGPTINPEVPNEKDAMELQFTQLETSIEDAYERLSKVVAEAAEARQRHEYARALGRVSAHLIKAQQKEAEARNIESAIKHQRRSLATLEDKLGKKARIVEPVSIQPGLPPGFYPPGNVPGMMFIPVQ